jgi:hypothetical protein
MQIVSSEFFDSDGEPEVDELESPVKDSKTKSGSRKAKTTRKAPAKAKKQPAKAAIEIESSLSEMDDLEPAAPTPTTPAKTPAANTVKESSSASVTTRGARLQQRNRGKEGSDGRGTVQTAVAATTTSKRPLDPSEVDSNAPPSKKPKPAADSSESTVTSYERLKAAGAFQGYLYSTGSPLSITDRERDRRVLVTRFLSGTYQFTPDYRPTIRQGKSSGQRIKIATKRSYADFSDWADREGLNIEVDGELLQLLTDEFIYWCHIDASTSDLMTS